MNTPKGGDRYGYLQKLGEEPRCLLEEPLAESRCVVPYFGTSLVAPAPRPRAGSTVMTMSFGRSLSAIMGPPSFDFLLDVADDLAHLPSKDRLVQDPRAQKLLDQALEPEA
jgi:hypothetical protein